MQPTKKELVEALKDLYDSYELAMRNEYSYPGDDWTPERDGDNTAIRVKELLKKCEKM